MESEVEESGGRLPSPSLEPTEVCFQVPWGHIAGKAWGNPCNKPVLALHGWKDNAGSYDAIAPLLATELYVVAVDWPGHGKSSHRPPGCYYTAYLYVVDIKYIIDALKWERFSIIAHSMGGGAATWFAGALPDQVERLVLLEALGFWSVDQEDIPANMGQALSDIKKLEYVDSKTYSTMDAVVDRILEAHSRLDGSFDKHCARMLALRGVRQLEDNSYQFSHDYKLNGQSVLQISHEVNKMFIQSIKCPVIIIIGDCSRHTAYFSARLEMVVNKDKLRVVQVLGGHHLHMYHANNIHSLINSFLNNRENKL